MLFGKYVNKFYLRYFFGFFFGVVFLVLVDIVQLKSPELIGLMTNSFDKYYDGLITLEQLEQIIKSSSIKIILIAVFMFVGRFVWRICILKTAHRISYDLRKEMFEKSLKLSQNYYKSKKVGTTMSYFTNDVDTVNEAYGWGMVMLVDSCFLSVLAFVKMTKKSWQLSLICLFPLLALVIASYFIDKKMKQIYSQRQKAYESTFYYCQELFTGVRVIKAFVREALEAKHFQKVNKNNMEKDMKLIKFNAFLDTTYAILVQLMFVICMVVGGLFIYKGLFSSYFKIIFSRGDMMEFIGYLDTIIWPMIALGQIVALRSRAKTSLERITKLLDEDIDVYDEEVEDVQEIKGKIVFNNLSYTYKDDNKYALKNISLTINQGENIGIIGKIGSGKSTLVNILLRLDNVAPGSVYIDDVDLMHIPLMRLRENIAFVPQDNFLYSTDVKDNVAFSNANMTEEEIIEAATFADVHNNIVDFIDGYRTLVGERGVSLSGGQKQRISIARAYAKHAPIMILDDSVSAVDVKTEETILKNIKEKRKGLTTIIVSSRVSTVSALDKVIVMSKGKVEAFGTHEELMKISPTYQRMVYLQELEKEVEGGNY